MLFPTRTETERSMTRHDMENLEGIFDRNPPAVPIELQDVSTNGNNTFQSYRNIFLLQLPCKGGAS